MNSVHRFLAFDFGAESGRAMLGTLENGKLVLEEIHRFPTQGLSVLSTRQWDITRMYGEMIDALTKCARLHGPHLDGIGVDTWGVDFGLLARDGTILGNPVHYRDHRHDGAMESALRELPADEVYERTGIQFLPFNSAWQLFAMAQARSPILEVADTFLMMADLFAYLICGRPTCEYTNASTTQLVNARTRTWDPELISKLGIPPNIFPEPTQPGTVIGRITAEVARKTGLSPDVPVIAPATHDTGSAVASVPVTGDADDWAYLSSGTWSLLGAELREPLITARSRELNFTNEGGVAGSVRFLKNIIGLWIVQECRRKWEAGGQEVGYPELMLEAEAAEPFRTLIDVDDLRLLAPADMEDTLRAIAREGNQPEPETRGAVVRCALESLALKYRKTVQELEELTGRKRARIHVIGGGSRNELLCRMTASACGIPVIAGPVEATAIGNILVQAMAVGAIRSLPQGRAVVAESFQVETYKPESATDWNTGRMFPPA